MIKATDRREKKLFVISLPKHRRYRELMPRLKLQLTSNSEESNHRKIKTLSARKTFGWAIVTLARLTSETTGKKYSISHPTSTSKSQIYSRGKIEFRKPNNPRLDKIERRVQNFRKFGKKGCSCNRWLSR